jgi:hypothetical protein
MIARPPLRVHEVNMTESNPSWLITCSCGWTREFSQRWAAESGARLHPMLGAPGATHIVRIEPPPDKLRREPERPRSGG